MAISIADAPGPFLCPFFPMPDLKAAPPVRHSLFHRLGLRSWLGKDGEGFESHSQFVARELSRQRLAAARGLPPPAQEDGVLDPGLDLGQLEDLGDDDEEEDGDGISRVGSAVAGIDQPAPTALSIPPRASPNFANVTVGLPRAQTFKRQNSERRDHLTPSEAGLSHRRAPSAERHGDIGPCRTTSPAPLSVPEPLAEPLPEPLPEALLSTATITEEPSSILEEAEAPKHQVADGAASDYGPPSEDTIDNDLEAELDRKWILNLSMRFRDKSDREKFFITFAEAPNRWRKVTVSCDYRDAEPGSLEADLKQLQYHREKNSHIYEAIRDSIEEIQFYDTVTNLKLETREGRLHVHVNEDINEVIIFPPISSVEYLNPLFIPESELDFDSHLSGFVYRVKHHGKDYVKKEITGPDTVEEFLYEINALHALLNSNNVINFRAIVVDETKTLVKGLLIDYAEQGALADIFYDFKGELTWQRRERWAKQIIKGLGDIHEAGFVQGDFTVSNVVVDENDHAKIIDINRRGCPIGWEPPEFVKKLESKQRISMYIGVKSDLYQLGMTLWALAMEEDEPGRQPRPLFIPDHMMVPSYFKRIVDICLSEKPQGRLSAKDLLVLFEGRGEHDAPMRGPEVPRYAPMQVALNGVYPYDDHGHTHVNTNYQLSSMYTDQHAKSVHFSSLPTSFSNIEDRLRYQPLGREPFIIPTSGDSPDFHFLNNDPQTIYPHVPNHPYSHHYHPSDHGTQTSLNSLDQNGQLLPMNPWTKEHIPIPYINSEVLRPTLASQNPTTEQEDDEVDPLERPKAETKFGPRLDDYEPMKPLDHLKSCPIKIPDQIEPIAPHPMHNNLLNPEQPHSPQGSPSVSKNHAQEQAKQLHGNTFNYAASAVPKLYGSRQHAGDLGCPALESLDLLNSHLPINPGFTKDCESNLPPPMEHEYPSPATSSAQTVPIPSFHPDTLLTSGLPMNPRYREPKAKPAALNEYGNYKLLSSSLPINPAFTCATDNVLPPHEHLDHTSRPTFMASSNPEFLPPKEQSENRVENLFASNLPINPHYTVPYDESQHPLDQHYISDLLSSHLPINPGHEKYSVSYTIAPSLQLSTESSLTGPDILPSPTSILLSGDLLTSALPINPRYKEKRTVTLKDIDIPPDNTLKPRKSPLKASDTLRVRPGPSVSSEDGLFTSTLPINPCHRGGKVRQVKDRSCNLGRTEPLSPELPGSTTPPPRVSPISSYLPTPPPIDLLLSGLPINPRYQAQQRESSILPKARLAIGDLLSSNLPINPAVTPRPASLPRETMSPRNNGIPSRSSWAELFKSVLPINPAFQA